MTQGPMGASFILLVQQHLAQALWLCNEGEKKEQPLELAQLEISLLEVIEEKTRGNLSAEEQRFLAEALHEARMAYVMAKQKAAARVTEQAKDVPAETASTVGRESASSEQPQNN